MNIRTICVLILALLILVNPVINIVEARTDTSSNLGSKKLAVGESWDMGNGWVLTAQSIDARTRSVWLELSRDGSKVDDKIVNVGQVYSWNNIFSTKISGVYAGATSDTVSLTDTYLNVVTPVPTLNVITPLPTSTIVEAGIDGSKKLAVGESWDMGDGWVLTAQSIDARAKNVWLVLSRDGSKVDDKIVNVGQVYSWNNIFSIKISGVYAGATSDTVSFTDIHLNKETTKQKTVETTTVIPQTTTPVPTATVTDTQPEVQPSPGNKHINNIKRWWRNLWGNVFQK